MCTSFILDLQWFINSNGDDSNDQQNKTIQPAQPRPASNPAGWQQQCYGAYLIQLTRYVYKINLGAERRRPRPKIMLSLRGAD